MRPSKGPGPEAPGVGPIPLWGVLGAMKRRWYVAAVPPVVAALLFAWFWVDSGVYSTRTAVSFTFPYESALTPDNGTTNESVIAFAGAVATQISPDRPAVRYSAGDAPYYGAGLRQGVLVGLQDDGSQWAPRYGSAVIEIRIVGPTAKWVAGEQGRILRLLEQSTRAQQADVGLGSADRITARVEPLTLTIEHITPSRLAVGAAVLALAAAAALASGYLAVATDRSAARGRTRPVAVDGGRR